MAGPEENIEVTMKVPCSIDAFGKHPWASTIRDIAEILSLKEHSEQNYAGYRWFIS